MIIFDDPPLQALLRRRSQMIVAAACRTPLGLRHIFMSRTSPRSDSCDGAEERSGHPPGLFLCLRNQGVEHLGSLTPIATVAHQRNNNTNTT